MVQGKAQFIKDLWSLTDRAKSLHKSERNMTLASVEIIGKIHGLRPWQHLDMSQETYLKYIGLSVSRYSKRRRVYILFKNFPEARAMFERGETEISHLVAIANRITKANAEILLEGIKNKSKREVEEFAARVGADGSIDLETTLHDILLRADEELLQMFNRAREVMAHSGYCPKNAEIAKKALELFLKTHDPMKKAERWAKRKADARSEKLDSTPGPKMPADERDENERAAPGPKMPADERDENEVAAPGLDPISGFHGKDEAAISAPGPKQWGEFSRKPIPAATRHRVWLRDGGRCGYIHPEGDVCGATMMLELDHVVMVCRGGDNSEANLRLRCRLHNQETAAMELGRTAMAFSKTRASP